MKRSLDVPLRRFVDKIINGDLSFEEALRTRAWDVSRGMVEFEDFLEWVDKFHNPSIVKLLNSIGSDIVIQLATASPYGYLSLLLSSKENYYQILKIRPFVFFELCRALFSDVLMEEIIKETIIKDRQQFSNIIGNSYDLDVLVRTSNKYSIYHLQNVICSLSTYQYWNVDNLVPSLSNYNIVPESWQNPKILEKCRNDKDIRLCVHDMFKMVYPLALPHQEYCFTQDVLLMIHAERFITIAEMLRKTVQGPEYLTDAFIKALIDVFLDTNIASDYPGIKSMQDFELLIDDHDNGLLDTLKSAKVFNETIRGKYDNHIFVVDDPNNGSNSFIDELTLFKRVAVHTDFDYKYHKRYFKHLRAEYNPTFKRLLKLDVLIKMAEQFINKHIENLKELYNEISSIKNLRYLDSVGISIPSVNIDQINRIKNYCVSWINEMKEDVVKYPYEQLFRDSDLVNRLSRTIFSSENNLICDNRNSKALVVYRPNNEFGFRKEEIPIPGCGNKWLTYLSKRLEFYFYSNEAIFYDKLRTDQGMGTLGKCFTCGISKENVMNIQLYHDPLFKQTFCGDKCRIETYEKHIMCLQ